MKKNEEVREREENDYSSFIWSYPLSKQGNHNNGLVLCVCLLRGGGRTFSLLSVRRNRKIVIISLVDQLIS